MKNTHYTCLDYEMFRQECLSKTTFFEYYDCTLAQWNKASALLRYKDGIPQWGIMHYNVFKDIDYAPIAATLPREIMQAIKDGTVLIVNY